jgi:hypothetical protein
MVCVLRL